ncbi:MAG TPA: DUF4468 domain-containing protein [Ferruginibacter sp.]|nr:DUF4468 domain-containing protein [Ferruginibacter sp.]
MMTFATFSQSDEFKLTDGKFTIDSVLTTPEGNATELYNKAMVWFSKDFPQLNSNVISTKDANNTIIATNKAYIPMPIYRNQYGYIDYTVTVSFRDGKYKYTLTSGDKWYTSSGFDKVDLNELSRKDKKIHKDSKSIIISFFNALSNSFHRHMGDKGRNKDW